MVLDTLSSALEQAVFVGALPGEPIRVVVALLGLVATAYYDIFHRRNVPEQLLYAFFIAAVMVNIVFYDAALVVYAAAVAILLGLLGYVFYRLGQWGGADVLVAVSIALLVPLHPSFVGVPFNYPFILSAFVFAFTLFALYVVVHYGRRLLATHARADFKYFLLLIPYAGLLYLFAQPSYLWLISPVYLGILSLTILASVFYLAYRESFIELLSEKVKLSQAEDGDIAVLERMPEQTWKYKIPRLLTTNELRRLKKLGLRELRIYAHLPPFLPFLLAGFLLALGFSRWLLA